MTSALNNRSSDFLFLRFPCASPFIVESVGPSKSGEVRGTFLVKRGVKVYALFRNLATGSKAAGNEVFSLRRSLIATCVDRRNNEPRVRPLLELSIGFFFFLFCFQRDGTHHVSEHVGMRSTKTYSLFATFRAVMLHQVMGTNLREASIIHDLSTLSLLLFILRRFQTRP